MAKKKNIGSIIFSAAIFIVLEIAALNMLSHNGELQNNWLARSSHAINAAIWGTGERISHYFSLKRENEDLALENYHLLQELRKYQDLEVEMEYGDVETIRNFTYIHASIIKHSTNKQHNYMILDKGADDGIRNGSGVITANGTIGVVHATSRHYSYVMTFNNKDMVISARIGGEGAVGPLTWDGITTRGAMLREIPHNTPFEEGDTVYTSGFSALFPADLPLGTVGSNRIVNGASYEIKVRLFEDLANVRYVTVVINNEMDEIRELEEEATNED
ncbi:MAG: rod shape-determining protein MreC [Bacteroidales bacterium]|nr:rod shape-determining protein MreC [Bacteroidales bacterium]